jgi:hypothetical protein
MSDPKTQCPHIPWPSNVNQIWTEIAELSSDPTPKPAQEGITVKMVVQWERRQTSFQFECGESFLMDSPSLRAAVNANEGEVLAPGKRGEFPAKGGYSVRLMEGVSEEGDA